MRRGKSRGSPYVDGGDRRERGGNSRSRPTSDCVGSLAVTRASDIRYNMEE